MVKRRMPKPPTAKAVRLVDANGQPFWRSGIRRTRMAMESDRHGTEIVERPRPRASAAERAARARRTDRPPHGPFVDNVRLDPSQVEDRRGQNWLRSMRDPTRPAPGPAPPR